MIKQHFDKGNLNFRDKVFALDYSLIFLVLLLGIISFFAMYSTEQGKLGYFTQSHIYRFFIFFIVFITISFFNSGGRSSICISVSDAITVIQRQKFSSCLTLPGHGNVIK